MTRLETRKLLDEYEAIIAELGVDATDEHIVGELVSGHDWTAEGARAILMLARTYGTAILRNALALAAAMQIEDGSSRL
jgi:hypothetical protein